MRTVLVGAVQSTRAALEALVGADLPPTLLVTLPPERGARHSDYVDLAPIARDRGIPLIHACDVNGAETLAAVAAAAPDLSLVVGWSQICHTPFRRIAPLGTVGFHPAPLPRMRGRAVIPWTILQDEPETGSTLFWLDEGADTGDIVLQRMFPVPPDATARYLYDHHLAALAEMLPQAVRLVAEGRGPRVPQDHAQATWCAKRSALDGRIDWRAPAVDILRLIRAVGDPYPGAFTGQDGERITIGAAEPMADSHRYIGLPGQVQRVDKTGFAVRCGDGTCIEVRQWHTPSGRPPRLHTILSGGA